MLLVLTLLFISTSFSQDTLKVTPEYLAKNNLKLTPQKYVFEIFRTIKNGKKKVGEFYEELNVYLDKNIYHRFQRRTNGSVKNYETNYFNMNNLLPISKTLISKNRNEHVNFYDDKVISSTYSNGKKNEDTLIINENTFSSNYVDYIVALMAKSKSTHYSFDYISLFKRKIVTWNVRNFGIIEKEINGEKQNVYHSQLKQSFNDITVTSNYYVDPSNDHLLLEEHISKFGTTIMIRKPFIETTP